MTTQPEALRLAEMNSRYVEVLRRKSLALSELIPHLNANSDELRRLHQSEWEGWRYADEMERERKALQQMLNDERKESETRIAALERALGMAVEALGEWLTIYGGPEYEDCPEVALSYDVITVARQTLGGNA